METILALGPGLHLEIIKIGKRRAWCRQNGQLDSSFNMIVHPSL